MEIRKKRIVLNAFIFTSVFVSLTLSSCKDEVPPTINSGEDSLCKLVGRDVLRGVDDTSFTMRYLYNSKGQIIRTKQYSGNEYYFPLWEDVDRADSADYFYTAAGLPLRYMSHSSSSFVDVEIKDGKVYKIYDGYLNSAGDTILTIREYEYVGDKIAVIYSAWPGIVERYKSHTIEWNGDNLKRVEFLNSSGVALKWREYQEFDTKPNCLGDEKVFFFFGDIGFPQSFDCLSKNNMTKGFEGAKDFGDCAATFKYTFDSQTNYPDERIEDDCWDDISVYQLKWACE